MKSIIIAVPQPNFAYDAKPYSPFRSNLKNYFRRYGMITFFIVVLFAGMIFGAVKAGTASDDILSRIDGFFSESFISDNTAVPASTFVNSFSISFTFVAVLYCLALSPLGVVLIPGVMFFRGFEYGMSSGFLCVTYGLKGLVYYISVMLLGAFISSLALVYVSQYCIDFSLSVMFAIFGKQTTDGQPLKAKFGELTLNCAYMIVLIVFASLLDTGLYYLIGGLFSF